MRGKSIALLVVALACGLVAAIGITRVIGQPRDISTEGTGETQPVFLALKDVPQGDPLTGQVLQLEQWPKSKVPTGALSRLEDIEGRRARSKLFAGELILDNKLASKGVNAPGADLMIPKGYRVVSIRVDAVSGGGNLLLPGCRVDLLIHIVKNPAGGNSRNHDPHDPARHQGLCRQRRGQPRKQRPGDQIHCGPNGFLAGHSRPGGEGDAGGAIGLASSW